MNKKKIIYKISELNIRDEKNGLDDQSKLKRK